eukprot:8684945-Heterocapsa_arctica.AAC.1
MLSQLVYSHTLWPASSQIRTAHSLISSAAAFVGVRIVRSAKKSKSSSGVWAVPQLRARGTRSGKVSWVIVAAVQSAGTESASGKRTAYGPTAVYTGSTPSPSRSK